MIFVTVGTQLAFPRLIDAMQAWAEEQAAGERVVAQTGEAAAGRWPHLEVHARMMPADFARHIAEARVIVAHAGIGTVLSARAAGRPLILVPRRADLGEHRNDHQQATVHQLTGRSGIYVVEAPEAIAGHLTTALAPPDADAAAPERDRLIRHLAGVLRAPVS
ncbi:MAG: glycosyltransferase [Pseudomonadota bacterium]